MKSPAPVRVSGPATRAYGGAMRPAIQRRQLTPAAPFHLPARPLIAPGVIQAYRRTLREVVRVSDPKKVNFKKLQAGASALLLTDQHEISLNIGFQPSEQWIQVLVGRDAGYMLARDYNRNTRTVARPTPLFDSLNAVFTPVLPAGTRVDITALGTLHSANIGLAKGQKWVQVTVSSEETWINQTDLTPHEILDAQAAQLIFDALKKGEFSSTSGKTGAIPFEYPVDGCYARAEAMSRLLEQWEVPSEKVFAVAATSSRLSVQTPFAPDTPTFAPPTVNWMYHVAPIVRLEDGTRLVMDPSVATTPLYIHAWIGRMANFSTFTERTLNELRQEAQTGVFSDRNQFYVVPKEVYHPVKFGGLNPAYNSSAEYEKPALGRNKLMEYAEGPAKLHKIAAQIRTCLARGDSDLAALIVRLMPDDVSLEEFSRAFPFLFADVRQRLTIEDIASKIRKHLARGGADLANLIVGLLPDHMTRMAFATAFPLLYADLNRRLAT